MEVELTSSSPEPEKLDQRSGHYKTNYIIKCLSFLICSWMIFLRACHMVAEMRHLVSLILCLAKEHWRKKYSKSLKHNSSSAMDIYEEMMACQPTGGVAKQLVSLLFIECMLLP